MDQSSVSLFRFTFFISTTLFHDAESSVFMPSYTAAICGSEVLLGGVDGVIRLSLSAEK